MKVKAVPWLMIPIVAAVASFAWLVSAGPWGGAPQAAPVAPHPPVLTHTLYLPAIARGYPLQTIFGVELDSITAGGGLNRVADAGATWVRRNGLLWSDVEPTEGARNWAAVAGLETELRNAAQRNLRVVLIVRSTPVWAQQVSGYLCGPIKPDKRAAFARFMRDTVARYSQPPYNVKYWEMYNEPDVAPGLVAPNSQYGCWGDTTDAYYGGGNYAEMLYAAYPAIKAADPQAQVLLGGLLLSCDPRTFCPTDQPAKFFEGALRRNGANDGANYFDGVSFHGYDYASPNLIGRYGNAGWASAWNTTGPVISAKVGFLRGLLGAYGAAGKFLVDTEVAPIISPVTATATITFETNKGYYVAQAYAVAISEGLRANVWYSAKGWRESGLLNPDLTPRLAYTAFVAARNELRDATLLRVVTSYPGVKAYEFNRRDRRVWVLWSLDGAAHAIALPGTPLAIRDVWGAPLPANANLTVDLKPLYVEWNP